MECLYKPCLCVLRELENKIMELDKKKEDFLKVGNNENI